MTAAQYKASFESLSAELQTKMRGLTREAMIAAALSQNQLLTDSEQAELEAKFGSQWREIFLGKGIAVTK